MKPKILLLILLTAMVASAVTWFVTRPATAHPATNSGERKILFYQSAMHPWIKSDQPGNCTICGMKLVPVYEGDPGFDAGAGITSLGSNIVQTINIASSEVKRRPLTRTLRVAGLVEDDDTRHRFISAYVDGRVEKLGVNFVGAEVKAGQPLATIYSPMLLNAEREFAALIRQTNNLARPDFVETQTAMIAGVRQRLRQLGLTDAQIDQVPRKPAEQITSDIVAPLDGTVVSRNIYEGQYVKEGDRLFEIADFSKMWFQFDAYERDLPWLRLGQQVEVATPSLPGQTLKGVITFIDPTLKEMTRSAKVRVELDNPLVEENGQKQRRLRHRLYAEASVQLEIPEVLAVPRGAVLKPGRQAVVYVNHGGGSFEQRKVTLGRAGDYAWEILGGLKEGEVVVLNGNLLIDAQTQLNTSANEAKP